MNWTGLLQTQLLANVNVYIWICSFLKKITSVPFHIKLFQHINLDFDSTMWHFELTATVTYIYIYIYITYIYFWIYFKFRPKSQIKSESNYFLYFNLPDIKFGYDYINVNSRCQFEVSHSAVKNWICMLKKFDVKRH